MEAAACKFSNVSRGSIPALTIASARATRVWIEEAQKGPKAPAVFQFQRRFSALLSALLSQRAGLLEFPFYPLLMAAPDCDQYPAHHPPVLSNAAFLAIARRNTRLARIVIRGMHSLETQRLIRVSRKYQTPLAKARFHLQFAFLHGACALEQPSPHPYLIADQPRAVARGLRMKVG